MTLEEAIKHCEEKADELNKEVLNQANLCNAREMADCQECARDHEQLAEWLRELKAYKESPKSELISRKALKAELSKKIWTFSNPQAEAQAIIDIIEDAPTVSDRTEEVLSLQNTIAKLVEGIAENARPQDKWGKWVISEIQCPICFEYFQTDCYSTEELKKCPSCGADMRGDKE